ncbi:MAG: glycolate oxidase subunit GlcF [Burkholderiaceae bacterium]
MQTQLTPEFAATREGREAEAILRQCVHCGFCTATCPTYQLLGDELDGPRGRIYLIKQVLEGQAPTRATQLHLDRCLTCRSCETTCPSGVQYGRLVDIGRALVDARVPRPTGERLLRSALKEGLTGPLLAPAIKLGQLARPLLPAALQAKVPAPQDAGQWPTRSPQSPHPRRMILLEGCVQPALAPNINRATARLLDALGIELLRPAQAGCCGALRHHLNDHAGGLADARRNIDAWWPLIAAGAEAIVVNASGCGTQVKDYGHRLAHDPIYADKATRIAALARDVSEVVASVEAELLTHIKPKAPRETLVFHPPCSLQHGQKIRGVVERILTAAGADLLPLGQAHSCCGSAGTYSVLQPQLSLQLRERKLGQLEADHPAAILSANIGCITHLAGGTERPVMHWVEWLDRRLH